MNEPAAIVPVDAGAAIARIVGTGDVASTALYGSKVALKAALELWPSELGIAASSLTLDELEQLIARRAGRCVRGFLLRGTRIMTCRGCDRAVRVAGQRGPAPQWCSEACRLRNFRRRKKDRSHEDSGPLAGPAHHVGDRRGGG